MNPNFDIGGIAHGLFQSVRMPDGHGHGFFWSDLHYPVGNADECRKTEQKTTLAPVSAPAGVPKAGIGPELIAAVSAAIAEEMGTDISAIRIISMKQI